MEATPEQSGECAFRHVYHLSPARLAVLPAVWLLFTFVLLLSTLGNPKPREAAAGVFVMIMLTAIVLPLVFITWRSRLVLTEKGITHFQFSYRIESSWGNLEALTLGPGPEGLILRAPGGKHGLLRFSLEVLQTFGLADAFGGRALAEGRFIALAPFMAHWRSGPLQKDIRRMAPHLFSKAV